MKKIPTVVANSIPKNTPVPIECRLPAPAPFATSSGTLTSKTYSFNANATPQMVTALIHQLVYIDTSDNPNTADRTMQYVLTDGDCELKIVIMTAVPGSEDETEFRLTAIAGPPAKTHN